MADRRPDSDEPSRAKRQKTTASTTDDMKSNVNPKANPYLAHMYENDDEDGGVDTGYSNGYGFGNGRLKANGTTIQSSALVRLPRHATTAAMAMKAEDGPNNPFTGKPLSKRYFDILRTRRTLPVHAQRYTKKAKT